MLALEIAGCIGVVSLVCVTAVAIWDWKNIDD